MPSRWNSQFFILIDISCYSEQKEELHLLKSWYQELHQRWGGWSWNLKNKKIPEVSLKVDDGSQFCSSFYLYRMCPLASVLLATPTVSKVLWTENLYIQCNCAGTQLSFGWKRRGQKGFCKRCAGKHEDLDAHCPSEQGRDQYQAATPPASLCW